MPSAPLSKFHLTVVGGTEVDPAGANERAHMAILYREDDPARVELEARARERLEEFEQQCADAGRAIYEGYILTALGKAIETHGTGFLGSSPVLRDATPNFLALRAACGTRKMRHLYGLLYRSINPGFEKMYAELERRYDDARRI